jgi:hypothetical protein
LITFTEDWVKSCGIKLEWLEMPKELNEAITEIAALREEFYKMLEFPERIKDLIKN